jgi:hypothetical protein
MTGYKGMKFFSKSFVWKRAPADLPRCDGNTAAVHDAKTTVGAAQPQANTQPQAPAQLQAPAQPQAKANVATAPVQPAPAAAAAATTKAPVADATPETTPPVETVARASDADILIPPRPVPAVRPQHRPIE